MACSACAAALLTIVESGLRGYDVRLWLGLLAPAGTPREVVSRMHSEIVKRGKVIQQVGTFDN